MILGMQQQGNMILFPRASSKDKIKLKYFILKSILQYIIKLPLGKFLENVFDEIMFKFYDGVQISQILKEINQWFHSMNDLHYFSSLFSGAINYLTGVAF